MGASRSGDRSRKFISRTYIESPVIYLQLHFHKICSETTTFIRFETKTCGPFRQSDAQSCKSVYEISISFSSTIDAMQSNFEQVLPVDRPCVALAQTVRLQCALVMSKMSIKNFHTFRIFLAMMKFSTVDAIRMCGEKCEHSKTAKRRRHCMSSVVTGTRRPRERDGRHNTKYLFNHTYKLLTRNEARNIFLEFFQGVMLASNRYFRTSHIERNTYVFSLVYFVVNVCVCADAASSQNETSIDVSLMQMYAYMFFITNDIVVVIDMIHCWLSVVHHRPLLAKPTREMKIRLSRIKSFVICYVRRMTMRCRTPNEKTLYIYSAR